MKCPNCGGTGSIANGMWLCCECAGTGFVDNNEEWLEDLTTKEKAKFISELMHHRSKYSFEMEKFLLDGAETHEQAVEMWLKERHIYE